MTATDIKRTLEEPIQTPKAVALIVAAGRGSRMSSAADGLAKQYINVGPKPVLAHALEPFLTHDDIAHVQVVIHPDDADRYATTIASCNDPEQKLLPPVDGGATRQISTLNGLKALETTRPNLVLIHDAARPFGDHAIIDTLLGALSEADGVIPALPVADTLKRVDAEQAIRETVPRDGLWRAQTPQAFRYSKIKDAHLAAEFSTLTDFTDDASILEYSSHRVTVIPGKDALRKLTTPADLAWADRHISQAEGTEMPTSSVHVPNALETRVGQGFDVHAFVDGDGLILCGVQIPFHKRLSGHSDADVGLHAITDALLGAIGDGDIGIHFPPSDPKWKGANSIVFLDDALRRVADRGGHVRHIDVTLICEQPKIGPHRRKIADRLATLLTLTPDRISIKATTTETLGFTGRGEGIAALAIATVALPASD